MSFDFPSNPILNEQIVLSSAAYVFDGQKWRAKRSQPPFEPAPLIASISPTQGNQNEAISLQVGGTYFEAATAITLDGVDAATTYISQVALTTTVPAQPYGKTSVAINVHTAALMGANADQILTLADMRVPLITAVSPTQSNQGVAFLLTVTGTDFWSATQITINGAAVATTFVNGTTLTTQVAAQPIGPAASLTVNVKSGVILGTNPNQTVTLIDTRTTFTGVSPVAGVQNEAMALTATGTYFTASSQITINGAAIPTTFVSATQLTASYTCPYFAPQELGPVDFKVNVTGSISPDSNVNCIDPRFKIRSCYPDYWSEWIPVNQIEVWGWGPISDQCVCYLGGDAKITRMQLNAVGTEFILIFDMENWPGSDGYYQVQVLNPGGHWSADNWQFWVERIGLSETGPAGPP